jgi:hypothetical protein
MTSQIEAGRAEIAGYSAEQQAELSRLFAAHEAHDNALSPGKPKYASVHWKAFCEYVRLCRAGKITSASRVAGGGWWAQYWRADVGSKLPPVMPALKAYLMRPENMMVWGLPCAVIAGGLASRAVHSGPGKMLIRSTIHAFLWATVFGPIMRVGRHR